MGRRTCVLGVVALAGCGRRGFDLRPGDASAGDTVGDVDVPSGSPPFIGEAHGAQASTNQLTVPANVPAATSHALVAVQLSQNCGLDPPAPAVTSVTLAGVDLQRVTSILGTPCGASLTRSEIWLAEAPAPGPTTAVATLGASVRGLHVGVVFVGGASPTAPVRAFNATSGYADSASLQVTSMPGDLVVSFAGHGNLLVAPDPSQTTAYVNNVDSNSSLDNTGAAYVTATATATTVGWSFGTVDEWQMIAVALRP